MWKVSREMNRLAGLASVAIVLGLVASLANGCTTNGEGGRCDHTNVVNGVYADCDTGLVCVQAVDIRLPEGGTSQADICCPSDRSLATTQICMLNPAAPGSDAGIPEGGFETGTPDVMTMDQSTTDVTEDTTSDVSSDVSTDTSGD
jgi:hypothetical protein